MTPDLRPVARTPALAEGMLAAALLQTSDWFDANLRAQLAARGWPRLTRTRSRLFLHLSRGVVRPAALARELDVSRQAVHKLIEGLETDGLLRRVPDPDDARAQLVVLTDRGERFVGAAGAILRDLERQVATRVGPEHLIALREALGAIQGGLRDPAGTVEPEVDR